MNINIPYQFRSVDRRLIILLGVLLLLGGIYFFSGASRPEVWFYRHRIIFYSGSQYPAPHLMSVVPVHYQFRNPDGTSVDDIVYYGAFVSGSVTLTPDNYRNVRNYSLYVSHRTSAIYTSNGYGGIIGYDPAPDGHVYLYAVKKVNYYWRVYRLEVMPGDRELPSSGTYLFYSETFPNYVFHVGGDLYATIEYGNRLKVFHEGTRDSVSGCFGGVSGAPVGTNPQFYRDGNYLYFVYLPSSSLVDNFYIARIGSSCEVTKLRTVSLGERLTLWNTHHLAVAMTPSGLVAVSVSKDVFGDYALAIAPVSGSVILKRFPKTVFAGSPVAVRVVPPYVYIFTSDSGTLHIYRYPLDGSADSPEELLTRAPFYPVKTSLTDYVFYPFLEGNSTVVTFIRDRGNGNFNIDFDYVQLSGPVPYVTLNEFNIVYWNEENMGVHARLCGHTDAPVTLHAYFYYYPRPYFQMEIPEYLAAVSLSPGDFCRDVNFVVPNPEGFDYNATYNVRFLIDDYVPFESNGSNYFVYLNGVSPSSYPRNPPSPSPQPPSVSPSSEEVRYTPPWENRPMTFELSRARPGALSAIGLNAYTIIGVVVLLAFILYFLR